MNIPPTSRPSMMSYGYTPQPSTSIEEIIEPKPSVKPTNVNASAASGVYVGTLAAHTAGIPFERQLLSPQLLNNDLYNHVGPVIEHVIPPATAASVVAPLKEMAVFKNISIGEVGVTQTSQEVAPGIDVPGIGVKLPDIDQIMADLGSNAIATGITLGSAGALSFAGAFIGPFLGAILGRLALLGRNIARRIQGKETIPFEAKTISYSGLIGRGALSGSVLGGLKGGFLFSTFGPVGTTLGVLGGVAVGSLVGMIGGYTGGVLYNMVMSVGKLFNKK